MFGPIPLPRYPPGPFFTSLPYCFYPFPMRDESRMFSTVEEAVEEIRQGRMLVLVDDEHRENAAHLARAPQTPTPPPIYFTPNYAPLLISLPTPYQPRH